MREYNVKRGRKRIRRMCLVLVVAVIILFGLTYSLSFNTHYYTVTVTDKDRIYDKDNSRYIVFTEDENGNVRVFENTDNLLRLKFSSSDLQGSISVGKTYTFTVVGVRVPILSMYENILKIEEGGEDTNE